MAEAGVPETRNQLWKARRSRHPKPDVVVAGVMADAIAERAAGVPLVAVPQAATQYPAYSTPDIFRAFLWTIAVDLAHALCPLPHVADHVQQVI